MVWPREDFLSANDSDFRFMAGSLDINTFSVDLRSASYSIGSILFLMPDKYELPFSLCVSSTGGGLQLGSDQLDIRRD